MPLLTRIRFGQTSKVYRSLCALVMRLCVADLVARREGEANLQVHTTWSGQGVVQLVRRVGGHDEYVALARSGTIDDVEESTQTD